MEENIYMLSDGDIRSRIGRKIREIRLRQNITQMSLAEQTRISVSTIKKIEGGEISSFDSLMRVLRILGELDIFTPLLREEEISPNEYLAMTEKLKKKRRKRASMTTNINNLNKGEESTW